MQTPLLGFAGGSAGVVRGERVDGVGEREPECLELTRKTDALDSAGLLVAVAGLGPRRRRQDPDALVEADGVDGHAGLVCDLTDPHTFARP